jgi:Immunoglobulin I-set domain
MLLHSPEPTIEWRRSGKPMPPVGRHSVNNFNTELVIRNVQPSDEGVYICKGANSVGVTEQTIYVDVQGLGFVLTH